jgi:hypothetical protein
MFWKRHTKKSILSQEGKICFSGHGGSNPGFHHPSRDELNGMKTIPDVFNVLSTWGGT